jgi:hypothetical protein
MTGSVTAHSQSSQSVEVGWRATAASFRSQFPRRATSVGWLALVFGASSAGRRAHASAPRSRCDHNSARRGLAADFDSPAGSKPFDRAMTSPTTV